MRIGILGSGDVGRKLADSFIEIKHIVKIGSRNPNQQKIIEWMAKHDKAKVSSGTFTEAASFGGGARLLEPLALLWITHYFRKGNGNHAFKLLRR